MARKPVMLMVLDGWGINNNLNEVNAIREVNPQNFAKYEKEYAGADAAVRCGAADMTAAADAVRGAVVGAVDILSTKRVQRLPKKHGNMSL